MAQPDDARKPVSYADAGVDLEAADRSVELLSGVLEGATRPEVLGGIGGFGGLFQLDVSKWEEPILVSGTDGVGTKVDLARRLGILDTVGQDLVAMVVDDLVVTGAEPLFFNDYISVGKLDPQRVADIVKGIADGCAIAGCALVGGETAEHPGLLGEDEFDLAGFGVGIVEKANVLGSHLVREGDAVIGMGSSGVHANGYSLVRRIVEGHDLDTEVAELGTTLGQALLAPTRIYTKPCLELAHSGRLHALCHVTGGGVPGNLPRVLPDHLGVRIDATARELPPLFQWLQANGPVEDAEMWRTFNCGVGMIAIVAPDHADGVMRSLAAAGIHGWLMGEVIQRDGEQVIGLG